MGNAIWLFLATPKWYFLSVLAPFSAGLLTVIPATGVGCLFVGGAIGIRHRSKSLLVFLVPFVGSQIFVAVAGLFRGALSDAQNVQVLMIAFLLCQIGLAAYLVYKLRSLWLEATLLAVFSISFAAYTAFVAGMSLTDVWL